MARGNAGTRWRRRSARELHQEEEAEEDNEVPETMGGQRRMCEDITEATSLALINRHQAIAVTLRVYAVCRGAYLLC